MTEEYRRSDRGTETKTRLRLKKRSWFVLILIALLIIAILYIIFSYRAGLNVAVEDGVETSEEEFNGVDNGDGKKTFLVLGADEEEDGAQRTDVIMLAQYDYMQKDLKLASIMRDVYVDIPGYQNYKINSVYSMGGVELLRQVIQENFNIAVEDYVFVDYQAFESVVNEINSDGINIDVEKDMSENIDAELKEGEQQLNGSELLDYARFREDSEGDFGRVRRQQQVVGAVKDEVLTPSSILNLPKITGTGMGYVNTSMSDAELYRMMGSFLIRGDKDIPSLTIPIDDSYQFVDTYHAGNVIDPDYELNSQILDDFFNNDVDDPTGEETSGEESSE